MTMEKSRAALEDLKKSYPEKFASEDAIFKHVNRGDRIFIGTACAEPQYLVQALTDYAARNPKAFFDAEVFHVWTLGVAPYTNQKFKRNFRLNSFFVGDNTRDAVNQGLADYTPLFLSKVPPLLRQGIIKFDIALVQTSLPDKLGYMSLGISVDIVKAAVETAGLVIVQVNSAMPRVHGDTFIHVNDVHFIVPHDEPLIEFTSRESDEIDAKIGNYVSRLVQDGDTMQVGYGRIPNAIMDSLTTKKHLGVHTELLPDGIVKLMKMGVVDNSQKTIGRGKTVASFCMGSKETYDFIDDNPAVDFRTIDITNNPLTIAGQNNMVAINSALQIDLTGQSSSESLGRFFYSGVGGHADFMRGATLSAGGKTILILRSTSNDGKHSRIVPLLDEGAGVTLVRGDLNYVVTEYGIAYLQGKNIRERAMDLIAIAHPKFRPWLIEEAKKEKLIYSDQAFIPGERGMYPEALETYRTTFTGMRIMLRPVKISDEPLLKDFFYSLSDKSMYQRFISTRKDMPHERLQEFAVIDYTQELIILALADVGNKEELVGVGQYAVNTLSYTADVAFVVRDDFHNKGIGTELLSYLTYLARRQGLLGFTAEVLVENTSMMQVFQKGGFDIEKRRSEKVYELKLAFKES